MTGYYFARPDGLTYLSDWQSLFAEKGGLWLQMAGVPMDYCIAVLLALIEREGVQ